MSSDRKPIPPPLLTTSWNADYGHEEGWVTSVKHHGYGHKADFEAFIAAARQSTYCGLRTVQDYNDEIRLWHEGLNLWRNYLSRDFSFDRTDPVWESQSLRTHLQRMAFNTSIVLLEICLDGAYTQSFSLLRFQFEAWQRIVYLRQNPSTARSWLNKPNNPPSPPGQNTIINKLRQDKLLRKGLAKYAEERGKEYDYFSHPTYRSLPLGQADSAGRTSLNLTFLPEAAAPILTNGIISNTILLEELPKICDVSEPWNSRLAEYLKKTEYIMAIVSTGRQ